MNKNYSLFVYALSSMALYYFSIFHSSNVLNFFSILLLAVVSITFLCEPRGGIIYLLFSFGLLFALFSNAVIELTQPFLIEINKFPELTGSAARNSFMGIFFITVVYASHFFTLNLSRIYFSKFKTIDIYANKIFINFSLFSIVFMVFTFILYGSPLTHRIDRAIYFANVVPPGFFYIYKLIPFFGLVFSLAVFKKVIEKKTAKICLIIFMIVLVFCGEKFSNIFLLLFFYFVPVLSMSLEGVKAKHLINGLLFIGLLSIIVFLNYTLIRGDAIILIARLALQGQMNYAIDAIAASGQNINVIIKSFIGFNSSLYDSGISFLMFLIAPDDLVERYLSSGVRFTAPFPANFSYFFGRGFMPFFVLPLGIFVGFVGANFYKAIISKNFILTMVLAKYFILVYVAVMMGEIWLIFSFKSGVYLVILIIYYSILLLDDKKNLKTNRYRNKYIKRQY